MSSDTSGKSAGAHGAGKLPAVLAIAGSDCSGGAGIQADLKTMTVLGCYGMSVITALTAQNTTGVQGTYEVPADFISAQLDSVFTDIRPDAVKCGMLPSAEAVRAIAKKLKQYGAENIVIDPVMVSTSGSTLTCPEAVREMEKSLFPLAALITPNMREASVLLGHEIRTQRELMEAAADLFSKYRRPVLLKGGHLEDEEGAVDCLATEGSLERLERLERLQGDKIPNPNTHGTGCTLSSAIASYLAMGEGLFVACRKAKAYLTGAIAYGLDMGSGRGPLNHMYNLPKEQ